ncbi:hypothetical protein [Gordonia sihwensis]|uniref:hypothetical protein n=1 Tax=Gordonia TaxID=2053 RepID=UPI0024163D29|nr:hypothetical protein [Gordonia sihwensis]WFN94388.1 hypothetical protein P5P27_07555 [Gordonia sihwensis]
MSTTWTVAAEELLARLDSMDPGAAAADAAEIARIVDAARAIGERMAAVFGTGSLVGAAADGGARAGVDLAERITSTSDRLASGRSSLASASGVLAGAVAYRPRVVALSVVGTTQPAVLSALLGVGTELAGVYNAPMDSSARGLLSGGPDASPASHGAPAAADTADRAAVPAVAGPMAVDVPSGDGPPVGDGPVAAAPDQGAGAAPAAGPPRPGVAADAGPKQSSAGPGPSPGAAPAAARGPTGPAAGDDGIGPPGRTARPGPSRHTSSARSAELSAAPGVLDAVPPPVRAAPSVPAAPRSVVSETTAQTTSSASRAASVPAGRTATAGNASASRPGGGPYGAAPSARRSEDEDGHRPADYLRSATEGILVLGPQPLVAPAVIGDLEEGVPEAGPGTDVQPPGDDDDQELDLTL